MCSLLIDIFGKLFERENGFAQLGSLLAAGFQSSHKLTVNPMIQMWNSTFGTKKQLIYPPALKAALERLQPFADIELPGFGIHAGNPDIADRPTFVDGQDEDAQSWSGYTEVSNDDSKCAETRALLSPLAWNSKALGSRSLVPQLAQTTKERTPVAISAKRKPRHDDSQVQYIAIESSPLKDTENVSQYLTDRQKEVRSQRQAEPAVVFPDLRSSLLPSNGPLGPTQKTDLSIDLKQKERFEDDRPASPTLPVLPVEGLDEEMASSPTPQSKQPMLRLDDIEMPSSPPSMPGCAELHAPPEIISTQVDIMQSAAFNDQTDNHLTPPRSCRGNETQKAQAGGNSSPAPEHPQQSDAPDIDGVRNDRDLADVERNRHLQMQGAVVDIARKGVDPDITLVSAVASDCPDMFIGGASGENRDECNLENAEDGAIVESVEFAHDRTSEHLAVSLEEEMQSEYVHQSSGLEDSLQEESKKEPCSSRESIQHDVEMAGVSPPCRCDPGQAEAGKQKEEEFTLERNVFKSPASDLQAIPEREIANPAVSDNSCVISRHSPAGSHHSHADGDEVDMLSASQLSQDLDWHVALERRASQIEWSSEAEAKPPIRKRKRSVGYFPSPKRRKNTCSPSDRGHQFLAQPPGTPGQAKKIEEVFDCIILDTTPQPQNAANQSSQLSSDAINAKQGPRKRGRKPKQSSSALQGQLSSQEDSGSSSPPEVVFEVEAIPLENEGLSEGEAAIGFPESEPMFTPITAPTSVWEGDDRRSPTEGAMIGSPQPLVTHIMSNNSSVAITGLDTAAASGKTLDEPFEPPRVTNLLSTSEPIHTEIPGDVQETEPGPDMAKCAACTPPQHACLPPQTKRPQHSPETQANTPLPVSTPDELDGAVSSTTEAEGMDVIGSLQQVLKRLKSARMERIALREIEDLLFEIRTEAQYAVGREVAGQ